MIRRLFGWGAVCVVALGAAPGRVAGAAADQILGDFEGGDFGAWKAEGEAFGAAPLRDGAPRPLKLKGFLGSAVAGSQPGSEAGTGRLVSPEFRIDRRFINFLIWGERNLPAALGVELWVDPAKDGSGGRVARAASATEAFDPTKSLCWRTWDVAEFAGRAARIRVNDASPTGAVAVDHFTRSDEAKAVVSDAAELLGETHRPQFHFTAESGWMNDANGLLHYKGQWHLFHQHRPPGNPGMVWGHATSGDLLRWRRMPTAIPCEGKDSIFSGSGMVDWENASGLRRGEDPPILLFYTLHPESGSGRKCTQCMAFSIDGGRTFQKFAANPILSTTDTNDRDPHVFFHKPSRAWFMVLSLSRNNTDREHATYGLYRSRDLKAWDLLQEIGPGSWYWECPDMFELPVRREPSAGAGGGERTKWLLLKGSGDYIVGAFDGSRFAPETEPIRTHWGGSYYGAQSFSDAPGGRRVQIGWMSTGKTEAPNSWPGMPFNQQMSFPRELTLRETPEGPRVFRYPIAEIEGLYGRIHEWKDMPLEPGGNPLAEIHHDLLDIELDLELMGAQEVRLALRGAEVIYDAKGAKLKVFGRALAQAPQGGRLILRALLDRTSIELFGNRGEVSHAVVFFPDPTDRSAALTVLGGPARIRNLVVRELRAAGEPGREGP